MEEFVDGKNEKIVKTAIITDFADELKFVDEDIRKEFEGKNYLMGTPTNVQLSRDIKKLSFYLKNN